VQTSLPVGCRSEPVAKTKSDGGRPPIGKPVNFRASDELIDVLEEIADGLSLDVSAVVRLILSENLGKYRERAADARKQREHKEPRP
jgi:hypothetical protein